MGDPFATWAGLVEAHDGPWGDAASGAIDLGDGAYHEDPSALGADARMLEVGDAGAARLDRAFATVARASDHSLATAGRGACTTCTAVGREWGCAVVSISRVSYTRGHSLQ